MQPGSKTQDLPGLVEISSSSADDDSSDEDYAPSDEDYAPRSDEDDATPLLAKKKVSYQIIYFCALCWWRQHARFGNGDNLRVEQEHKPLARRRALRVQPGDVEGGPPELIEVSSCSSDEDDETPLLAKKKVSSQIIYFCALCWWRQHARFGNGNNLRVEQEHKPLARRRAWRVQPGDVKQEPKPLARSSWQEVRILYYCALC